MKLIQFGGGGGRLLGLLKHLKRVYQRIPQRTRSGWAGPQSAASGEAYRDAATHDWRQNAVSQFNLDGAVEHAVGRYHVEINDRGVEALLKRR